MPVRRVKGGWQWGKHGTVYPTKEQAEKQAEAAYANGYKELPWHNRPLFRKKQ
jgi:hypothetical protein